MKLTDIERQRAFARPTESAEAYDLVLRARALLDFNERGSNREARALLARAQGLSPDFADTLIAVADAEMQRALYGWIEDAAEGLRRVEELCKRVLGSPDQRAHTRAHALIAAVYGNQGRFEDALLHAERAIELNPSDSKALSRRGAALLYVGRIDEAITTMEVAKRFEPHLTAGNGLHLVVAHYVAGRYRDALVFADTLLTRVPHHVAVNAVRAAALAQLGDTHEAREAAERVHRLSPFFKVENFGARFRNPEYAAKIQEGMRKAGL